MTPLNANVPNAGSDSIPESDGHVFPWKWWLKDIGNIPQNGLKVMSTFSCGGGSSMGYKLAGYELIANVQIDREMNKIYNLNHHPKYSFNMDIRDFLALPDEQIPAELFSLDVLDGSPPCSTFSMAGKREAGWGKQKVFREGQKKQRLDDLFFTYIALVNRLRPKVAIAENVKGLASGNAKGYVNEIFKAFKQAGYNVQMFLCNGARMGVPQARERVFFVAYRSQLNFGKLNLSFNEPLIPFGEVRSKQGVRLNENTKSFKLLQYRRPEDKTLADINMRLYGRNIGFTWKIISDDEVCKTMVASGQNYRMYDGMGLSKEDIRNVQTFPQDYEFLDQSPQYVCGMSVPPVMTAQIARQVYLQWLKPKENSVK